MRALLGLLLLVAACDKVLGLKEDKDRKFDAAPIDADLDAAIDAPPDASVVGCGANNLLHTSFTDDTEFDLNWDRTEENGSTTRIVDHALAVTTGTPIGYAQATTNRSYNFTNGVAVVKLVDMPIATNVESSFQMGLSATNEYFFLIDSSGGSGELRMSSRANNATVDFAVIAYNPNTHRFLQFRYDNTTTPKVVLETSSDGITFAPRLTSNVLFSLTAITFTLGTGSYNPGPIPPTTARFDDFDFCR